MTASPCSSTSVVGEHELALLGGAGGRGVSCFGHGGILAPGCHGAATRTAVGQRVPASSGTSTSADVSEPCRQTSANGPESAGSWNVTGRERHERHVAEPGRDRGGDRRAEPLLVDDLLPGDDPGDVLVVLERPLGQVVGAAVAGVPPAEATLAGLVGHEVEQLGGGLDRVVADLHLAVVGGDQQHRARRQDVEEVADEAVGGAQLGVVEVAEAALVGGLVDPAVVGVHEALPGSQLVADLDGDRRRGPVADGARPAEVALGERRALELGRRDDGDVVAEERGERLHVARRVGAAPVAAGARPAQHVEHLARQHHAVADAARARPGSGRWRSS